MCFTMRSCVDAYAMFFELPHHHMHTAQGPEDKEDLPVDVIVGCRPRDVSPWVFSSLNDAGIVYDGRIVVDGAFRSSDASIYAAGTVAKLSRRYGHRVQYEHYNR